MTNGTAWMERGIWLKWELVIGAVTGSDGWAEIRGAVGDRNGRFL
jgi:hypothetical protein